MNFADLINKEVVSAKYQKGHIIAVDDECRMAVRFEDKTHIFKFPQAFTCKKMTLCDEAINAIVQRIALQAEQREIDQKKRRITDIVREIEEKRKAKKKKPFMSLQGVLLAAA